MAAVRVVTGHDRTLVGQRERGALRVGLIARADDRGLGYQTWDAYRELRPWATVVIDPGELARGFPQHFERFPDALVMPWNGHVVGDLDWTLARFDGCHVVLSCETFYDWRLVPALRERGIATVCQGNAEFYRHPSDSSLPHPTMWWAPSPWRFERWPGSARLVPVPVRAIPQPAPSRDGLLRVLHVAGHRAVGDRNGTVLFLQALRRLRTAMHVRIVSQNAHLTLPRGMPRGVEIEVITGGVPGRWSLYDDADVLVMPRRFGGLCLPVQEAMARGLAVVMTDLPENRWWPILPVAASPGHVLRLPCGNVQTFDALPARLAALLERLAIEPDLLADYQQRSHAWALAHSWEALRSVYEAEFALAERERSGAAA